MNKLLNGLATGDWLTAGRLRGYSLILLALFALGIAALGATSDGLNDYQNRPLGTDFSNVYAAGTLVLEGKPEAPFYPPLQHAREREIFGDNTPFYGWHYPPVFLFIAALAALLPYLPALLIWQATTLGIYLVSIRAIIPRAETWLLAAAYPAVFINLTHGHNGLLTAALIGTGLWLLPRRPVLAGVLCGLLIYKPQFGVLLPLAFIAGGHWRAFIAATLTVVAVCAASYFAFGAGAWEAFRQSLTFTREVVLEQGQTGFHKIQSVFSAVRMLGGGATLAYAAQAIALGSAAICVIWLWRGPAAYALKAAALIAASMLATPYLLDYDLMIAAPAIAFIAAHGLEKGFAPYEKSALAFVWIAPLIARSIAEYLFLPLGLIAIVLLFGLPLRRALQETAAARHYIAAVK